MSVVYNPGLLKPEALIRSFVARLDLLEELVEELRHDRPGHRLLVGQRGMGKTTLLRRVAVEVARDPSLAERWLPLTFPEEQYNVQALSDFWLNCLDAAADALQERGEGGAAAELDTFVAGLPTNEPPRAALAHERLRALARTYKGLLLCVDNLQQVLGRLSDTERWALREALSGGDPLVVFAASPALPADTSEYAAPFYDFFQVERLESLPLAATRDMLGELAKQASREDVAAALAAHPARFQSLHTLTGGNPRTVALLFEVLLADPEESVQAALEALIDRATPLYKARFEELAEQAQIVLGALCLEWHPATAARLAEATRLDVNTVSTQLTRLHRDGLVLKVEIPGQARTGFLVAERFFSLWYLMRASRRLRGRMLGFARALETLYAPPQLDALARQFARGTGTSSWLAALASVVPDEGAKRALWSHIPVAEAPELVCEPAGLAHIEARESRKAHVANRLALVDGLDVEAHGVTRAAAAFMAIDAPNEELEGGGNESFWRDARLASLIEFKGFVTASLAASALGLDPDRSRENAQAASLITGYPGLLQFWEARHGGCSAQSLIDTGDLLLAALLAPKTDDPPRILIWLLEQASLSPGYLDVVHLHAVSLGLPELAVQARLVGPVNIAGHPEPAFGWPRSPVENESRARMEVAWALAAKHPLLAADFLPMLGDTAELLAAGWVLAGLLRTHEPALRRLAERARAADVPILPDAIDIALARDASLLGAYAPEYQAGLRQVLKELWPELDAAPKKAPAKGPRTTRPPRRP